MSDYEQKTITVASSAGSAYGPTMITAHVHACGLAYHKSYHGLYCGPLWTVTHIKSGYTLCSEATQFKNEAQCKAFISRVANLGDWTQDKPVLSEDVKANVRRIATDCLAAYLYTQVF